VTAPRYVAPADWTGRAEDRPGLMWRKAQVQEYLEQLRAQADGPPAPVCPDRVLANWAMDDMAEVAALCRPARLALGVTAKRPDGQLGPGWRWRANIGFGIRGSDGAITQSLALKLHHRERDRRALFYWTRPVPDPRVMIALAYQLRVWYSPPPVDPMLAAVLAQLPDPAWTSELTSAWTDDMPRKAASAAVKAEIRS
jgi:hypothetical protein